MLDLLLWFWPTFDGGAEASPVVVPPLDDPQVGGGRAHTLLLKRKRAGLK